MSKKHLEYNNYLGSVDFDIERGVLHGKILHIRDLVTFEATDLPALEEAFQDSVDEYLEDCAFVGKDPDKAFSGTFNVRIGADLHRKVSINACVQEMNINEYIKHCIKSCIDAEQMIIEPRKVENHTHNHFHAVISSEADITQSPEWEINTPKYGGARH